MFASKNTAVCCLTARKSPRNSSLPLGLAIYILRKCLESRTSLLSSAMAMGSCTAPRGIEHYGNWVCRPTTSLRAIASGWAVRQQTAVFVWRQNMGGLKRLTAPLRIGAPSNEWSKTWIIPFDRNEVSTGANRGYAKGACNPDSHVERRNPNMAACLFLVFTFKGDVVT